jgi:hypothetical protein
MAKSQTPVHTEDYDGVSKKFVGSTVGQRCGWGTIRERVPQKTYENTGITPENVVTCNKIKREK